MQLVTSKLNSPQLHPILLENNNWLETENIQPRKISPSLQPFGIFRGEIIIGNFSFAQKFSFEQKGNLIICRNNPTDSFPKIELVFEKSKSKITIKDFNIERSDNSVWGELQYTGKFLMISENKNCYVNIKNLDLPQLRFNELPKQDKTYMLRRAKLARKLRFLEVFFKTTFNLPDKFDETDLRQTEILFRGVTEGEFSMPFDSSLVLYNYKLTKQDLDNLSIPNKQSFSLEANEDLLLLGKFFSLGKMTLGLDKAAIANPRSLRGHKIGDVVERLRLNIFDYQVNLRFSKYVDREKLSKNKRKLNQFKDDLLKEEPEFLVNLIDEPLAEVTENVAVEIVSGWLQFYDFPDRYGIGEPILEGADWRVPIIMTYPKGKTIWIEDAFVHLKTGIIRTSGSVEKLREKGKQKAEEVFSAV